MKKVIVFGGSGFLGSYVVEELLARNYTVIVADTIKSPYIPEKIFKKVDILNLDDVKNAVEADIDFVYNFAALANLDEAVNKPLETMELNVIGNINILESCKGKNIKRFVYSSSAYAVSKKGSFYGLSKQFSEKIIEEYKNRYSLNYTIIRYGSLYGERASHNNYIYNLIKNAIQANTIEYFGNDDDIREYIHAKDAAKLSVDIIEDNKYENEHIILTGMEKLKRKELILMINEILNNTLKIKKINKDFDDHYRITPYNFHQPTMAKKLVANPYIDMGQGLVECIKSILEDNEN